MPAMEELLRSVGNPADLLLLSTPDLAHALLSAMQQPHNNPLRNTNHKDAYRELNTIVDNPLSPMEWRKLEPKLETAFRKAFNQLEEWGLIEPMPGMNGDNGFIQLTDEGVKSIAKVDYEVARQRQLLKPDMLHSKLQGKVYQDFLAGRLGDAAFGAFKIIEIDVRSATGLPESVYGAQLMQAAFNEQGGALTDMGEEKSQRRALQMLFEGSFGRFRNPEGHTDRVFASPIEAMQELMLASRLLTLIERRGRR